MGMTRRDVVVGLLAMPAALQRVRTDEQRSACDGPDRLQLERHEAGEDSDRRSASLCKSPTATVDQLEMHVTTLNPGMASHPPHRHVNEELIIIREGDCETLSNGNWVKVGPGSVVFNASNSLHGFRNVGARRLSIT